MSSERTALPGLQQLDEGQRTEVCVLPAWFVGTAEVCLPFCQVGQKVGLVQRG